MPELLTRDFGPVTYSPDEVFHFPFGLAGFPDCRYFLTLRPNPEEPMVVLQAIDRPEVAFLTLPAHMLLREYSPRVVEADLQVVGRNRSQWHTLVFLTLPEQGPATANLLGPVILNLATRRAVQAIRDDGRYSATELLEALLAQGVGEREAVCS